MTNPFDGWRNAVTRQATIDDSGQVMTYNVMGTPGVVNDAKVVHAGGVAARSAVENLLPAIMANRWFACFSSRGVSSA